MGNTQTRMASESADNLLWDRYTGSGAEPELGNALSRATFTTQHIPLPLHALVEAVSQTSSEHPQSRLLVVAGRSRRLAVESHEVELQQLVAEKNASLGSETMKTLGDVGSALVASNTNANLLVLQAFLS